MIPDVEGLIAAAAVTRVKNPLKLNGEEIRFLRRALDCKAKDLAVVLVTNTLWRGDDEAWVDWQRFGLADAIDHIVTSHTAGWQKPHEQIFRRALGLAAASPDGAVMVGDRMRQDVWGAKRLGMRAVFRRSSVGAPQEEVDVLPDATIDDLTELPAKLERWL